MFYKFGKLTVRFRWPIIVFWAVLLLAALPVAPRVTSELKSGFGKVDTESKAGLDVLAEELGTSEAVFTLVFSSDHLTVTDQAYLAEMERILSTLSETPQVEEITTFYNSAGSRIVSDDGHTTFAIISLDMDVDDAMDLFPQLREKIKVPGGSEPGLKVWATGAVPIFSNLNAASERDLRRAEAVSLPLVLAALFLVFGGVVAAGLPLVMGIITVSISLAAIFFLGQVTDVSIFVLNIVSFLGQGGAGAQPEGGSRRPHHGQRGKGPAFFWHHLGTGPLGASALRVHDAQVHRVGRDDGGIPLLRHGDDPTSRPFERSGPRSESPLTTFPSPQVTG